MLGEEEELEAELSVRNGVAASSTLCSLGADSSHRHVLE